MGIAFFLGVVYRLECCSRRGSNIPLAAVQETLSAVKIGLYFSVNLCTGIEWDCQYSVLFTGILPWGSSES